MSTNQAADYLRGLRYNIHMFGIAVFGPTFIYGDNHLVLVNTSAPESTLKKKIQNTELHFIHEGCAPDE